MSRGPSALWRESYQGRECFPWHRLQVGTLRPQVVRTPQASGDAGSSAEPLGAGAGSSWPVPGLCPGRVAWARAWGQGTEAASEKLLGVRRSKRGAVCLLRAQHPPEGLVTADSGPGAHLHIIHFKPKKKKKKKKRAGILRASHPPSKWNHPRYSQHSCCCAEFL